MKEKDRRKSFFKQGLENFALALSIMYLIVIVSYAVMKGLFNLFMVITFGIVLLYVLFWGYQNYIRKIYANF